MILPAFGRKHPSAEYGVAEDISAGADAETQTIRKSHFRTGTGGVKEPAP